MGWRGFLREVNRAQRASERAALRRHRELVREHARQERQAKLDAKAAVQEAAEAEFAEFESYLEVLVSVHKDCDATWDWKQLAVAQAPTKPRPSTKLQNKALKDLQGYTPGFWDKLLGRAPKKKAALERAVVEAVQGDKETDQDRLTEYTKEYVNWGARQKLAGGVLSQDPETMKRALQHAAPFEELAEFKTRIVIDKAEPDVVALTCFLEDEELVPTEELRLSASSKLSRKEMPASRYWTLHQDYVCSCALRAARETLAVLPIARVIVNVSGKRLDSSTGNTAFTTILAVHFTRSAMSGINFATIDPSDSLKNFNCRMKFKKGAGFDAVAPITTDEQWVSA